jgi:hypothetical protein
MTRTPNRWLKPLAAAALLSQAAAAWAVTAPVITNRTRVTSPAPVVSTPVLTAPKPTTVTPPGSSSGSGTPTPVVIISICPSNAGSLCGRSS